MKADLDPIIKGIPDLEKRVHYEKLAKIWELSEPFQDKRDDEGHTRVVTQYAAVLLESFPDADPNVVIPAAILHDVGWSQLTPEERLGVIDGTLTKEQSRKFRYEHQIQGAKLAIEILARVNYDPQKTVEILEIILGHDTRDGSPSLNDSLMRDADKLWRFSSIGLAADPKRDKVGGERSTFLFWIDVRVAELEQTGYFFTDVAREFARVEISNRKQELLTNQ